MGEEAFDLCIARLKKNTVDLQYKDKNRNKKSSEDRIVTGNEIEKISNFTFAEHIFFEGLFSMVLPEGIFNEPLQEGNTLFFQSYQEQIVLVVKTIQIDSAIDLEKMKIHYIQKMKKSKQQTTIDLTGACDTAIGQVSYFTAVHSMPLEAQCDFIIIFRKQYNMVIMNFDFFQKNSLFWKTVIRTLLTTIQ